MKKSKKTISLIMSVIMTAVIAFSSVVYAESKMPKVDTSGMVDITANTKYSGCYVIRNGVYTTTNAVYDTYANQVLQIDGGVNALTEYVYEFTGFIPNKGKMNIHIGGTVEDENWYITSGSKITLEINTTNIICNGKTQAHGLEKGTDIKGYISYIDGVFVYGIKAIDADDSEYIWGSFEHDSLAGRIRTSRFDVESDRAATKYVFKPLSMHVLLPETKAEIIGEQAAISGTEITASLSADGDLPVDYTITANAPETISITDGKTTVKCAARAEEDKIIITLPSQIKFLTEYSVDLSGAKAVYTINNTKYESKIKNTSFDTSLIKMKATGISWEWYKADGTQFTGQNYEYDNGTEKLAVLMRNGKPVRATNFALKFNYTDTSDEALKTLNAVFGVNHLTTLKTHSFVKADNFNGLAGISSWNGKRYNMYFGNETNSDIRFYKDQGEVHDLDMANGKTYNMDILYVNRTLTMKVKEASEEEWRTYTREMPEGYSEIENGYIALISNFSGKVIDAELYLIPSEDGILCFSDDFEGGAQNWTIKYESMYCRDGVLENAFTYSGAYSDANLDIPYDNMPENPVIKTRISFNSGSWLQIHFPTASGMAAKFLLRNTLGIYDYSDGQEVWLKKTTFEKDVMYDFKFVCNDETIAIYYKKASDTSYVKGGEVARQSADAPGFKFHGYGVKFKVDKVEFYRNDITDFVIDRSPMIISVGESYYLGGINNTEQDVTWSVSDTESVSLSGSKLTGVKSGNSVLTMTSADGSYTHSVPVVCLQPVDEVILSHRAITITEGEVINLSAGFSPSDVSDKTLIWKSSDESIVSLFGESKREKTVKAEKAGCVVIRVTAPFGDAEDICTVTVVQKQTKGTASAIFEAGTEKTAIEPLIFGMHRATSGSTNSTNQLYSDLGVKSLRSFLNTSSVTVESNLESSRVNNIPQVVMLGEFKTKTVEELLEIVKEVEVHATANDTIYIEMGNELYDGSMNCADYIAKCKEFYTAVKEYNSAIKIGIVVMPQALATEGQTWNKKVAEDNSFYDAVIVHNYVDFYNADNITREEMTDSMYAYNRYIEKSLYDMHEQFGGKELWITEYGHLQLNMFREINGHRNEINRLQTGKSVGVALTNVEKLLDMAESGIVQISNYHFDSDTQGFGVIQGTTKLPNYYAFKKVGELLNTYPNMFKMTPLKADLKNSGYRIKSNPLASNVKLPSADCWGFGNDSVEKIIIANRNSEPMRFSLSDYELKKEWSYGGENSFDHFLLWEGEYYDVPSEIPLPTEYSDEAFADIVELEPYSMTVCEINKKEDVITAAFNIEDGEVDVQTDKNIILTFSKGVNADLSQYITVNNGEVPYTLEKIADNQYKIILINGLEKDTRYTIAVNEIANETVSFTTQKGSMAEYFTQERDITGEYDDYEVTFRTSGNAVINVRNIPIYIYGGVIYYNNGITKSNNSMSSSNISRPLGHYNFSSNGAYFKITASGTEIKVYAKASETDSYTLVGTIYNAPYNSEKFTYSSAVKDIVIKTNPKPVTSVEYSQTADGTEFLSNSMLADENTVNIKTQSDANLIYAEYNSDGTLKAVKTLTGETEYSFITDNDGLEKKIFIWDSVNGIKSLQDSISVY